MTSKLAASFVIPRTIYYNRKCCANSVASALGTVLGSSAREVNRLDGDQEFLSLTVTRRSDMQMAHLSGAGTPRRITPHDEHRIRWKLRLFTWPFRHRSPAADSLTSRGSEPVEFSATSLLQECEFHDEVL